MLFKKVPAAAGCFQYQYTTEKRPCTAGVCRADRRPSRMVVLSDLHNSEFGAYNSELVDKVRRRWPAFYLRIPVGHVEAGLRTYDLDSPYPEELNRQAVGVLAKYNFAPTEQAKQNLLRKWFSWWAVPRTFPAWHTA